MTCFVFQKLQLRQNPSPTPLHNLSTFKMACKRPSILSARVLVRVSVPGLRTGRTFASSAPRFAASNANRIYTSVRNPDEFANLLLLSASTRRPLITLWSASWCPSCQAVKPILEELVGKEGVGEEHGGVGYAEVEVDAATIGDLPITYRVSTLPRFPLVVRAGVEEFLGRMLSDSTTDQLNADATGIRPARSTI